MKVLYDENYIRDGKLDSNCGRIVLYGNDFQISYGQSADHNYLLRSLAARNLKNKDDIISNATRLYYKVEESRIVVSPVRKTDDENVKSNKKLQKLIIEAISTKIRL